MHRAGRSLGRLLAALGSLGLGAWGCGDDATGATVVIYSELPDGALDQVDVHVARAGGTPVARRVFIGEGGESFPVRVPLVHRGGALGPITVSVTATGPDLSVAGGADPFYFVAGEQLTIPVTLTAACVGVPCPAGQRCVDGSCRDLEGTDAGPPPEDLGPPDLGPPDAGLLCEAGCDCVLDECVGLNCDCDSGCACALSCPAGASCDHLHCKDPGTACTIDAQGATTVEVNCDDAQCTAVDLRGVTNGYVRCHKDNACCIVDCSGAENCFVDCESAAYCRVDCTGATNCGFVGAGSCWTGTPPLDCGGGIQVCGQATCPADAVCHPGVDPA